MFASLPIPFSLVQARIRCESLQLLQSPSIWHRASAVCSFVAILVYFSQEESFVLVQAVVGRIRDADKNVLSAACKVWQFFSSYRSP